ncbi:MAG TPA: acetyl-CoA C-acetyltransferase [Thermomicrobiales bacterium]|nr:acetyl-CoA C-acetyltransferase [Thermomicrobiales bacterium]
MGERSVLIGGARTPFGKMGGALAPLSAVELGQRALTASIERAGVPMEQIENVIFGQVLQGGAGQNPARQVALGVGLDRSVTAETINRVCGSGMRAITLADTMIRAGDYRVIAAGGMESMSNAPYIVREGRFGYRMGNGVFEDMMITDGLQCAIEGCHMGIHGGSVAAEENISREEQDAWALRSHQRAIAAIESGRMARQIVPVDVPGRKGQVTTVETDEAPRADTSPEALAKLRPAFDPNASVTAGNAPGVNDGAASIMVTSESWARENEVAPRATVLGHAASAWDAPYLAYTPAMAIEMALDRAGIAIADVDLVEINEAFASVTIISSRRLGLDLEKVNVNGGAIALGHPIGASGTRIVLTLIQELEDRGGGIGVAAICSGGGQGDAIVIKVDA